MDRTALRKYLSGLSDGALSAKLADTPGGRIGNAVRREGRRRGAAAAKARYASVAAGKGWTDYTVEDTDDEVIVRRLRSN